MSVVKIENNIETVEVKNTSLVECDICKQKFSAVTINNWPFCKAAIPHEKMESKEQIRRQELLFKVSQKIPAFFTNQFFRLYGPKKLSYVWKESQLPEIPCIEKVILTRDTVTQFRDWYFMTGIFTGNILGEYNWTMNNLREYVIGYKCQDTKFLNSVKYIDKIISTSSNGDKK